MTGPALVLWAACVPPLLVAAWLLPATRRFAAALAPVAPVPALALAAAGGEAVVSVPGLVTGVTLGLDPVGRAFLFFTAALWIAAGAYGRAYLASDPRRDAFFGFHLVTLTGQITLVLAQDIVTFYLGFAVMTFAGYGLVVHSATDRARHAARAYLSMAVGGEALVLSAILLIAGAGMGWTLADVGPAYGALGNPVVVAALVVAGFGVKAGLVPLHLWLPVAHPVAPTPASALLSGAMIKAGLLGWIRFLPLGEAGMPSMGMVLVTVGVVAAFYGVIAGLAQREAKTILAYSSVSQMGFMATGIGVALAMPVGREGVDAAIVAITHYAGHHGAAKAALFLAVGVAPAALASTTGPRRVAFLAAVLAPALALAGAPFTSGANAKAALKAAGASLPHDQAAVLGVVLSLAAVGTTILMARFITVLRFEARDVSRDTDKGAGGPPPIRRLAGWWLALVAFSLAAPVWLPWTLPAPPGVVPDPGLVDAVWPVALGATLAAGVWAMGERWPLRAGRIPPGDLLVPVTRLARWARRASEVSVQVGGAKRPPGPTRTRTRAARWLQVAGARADRLDAGLAAGPALGLLLLVLFVAVAAALVAAG